MAATVTHGAASSAKVETRCEAGQTAGRTHLGDLFDVPVH
jgi:hypothetical protein